MSSSQDTQVFPVVKVVVGGDGAVGKTSLIRRYCTGMFEESRVMTIGVDFQVKIVEVDGRSLKLSIWDIAGQDRFGAFRDTFYRGAQAVALVYDVTDILSMNNLANWHRQIVKVAPKASFCVVGNKLDLHRVVPRRSGEGWARSLGFPYVETSAKTTEGVEDFFLILARLAARAV
ncbi:MAG TPA: GTP-binding protein [Anaerolineae bacterium]|nr:GTP-binding protein [Anaerolineae bacterium]